MNFLIFLVWMFGYSCMGALTLAVCRMRWPNEREYRQQPGATLTIWLWPCWVFMAIACLIGMVPMKIAGWIEAALKTKTCNHGPH